MKKTLLIIVFLLGWLPPAKAFLLGGFIKLVTLPIRIPLHLVSFVGRKSTTLAYKGTKASLRNISISTGPVKIRPFDFQ